MLTTMSVNQASRAPERGGAKRDGKEETALNEQIQARLEELRREFEMGQQRLNDLEGQAAQLRQTMLRISGAIQVLEEILAQEGGEQNAAGAQTL